MKQSEFAQLVERYRRYDNRALVVTLAQSYGRRDMADALLAYTCRMLNDLGNLSDYPLKSLWMERGLRLVVKQASSNSDYEAMCVHAIRDVMEGRNFHMEQYLGGDFPVPDNWDMLDKSNPEYPPIVIEGETK